jgi:hypothetical protein
MTGKHRRQLPDRHKPDAGHCGGGVDNCTCGKCGADEIAPRNVKPVYKPPAQPEKPKDR